MIPQNIIDMIHADIDHTIENISKDVGVYSNPHVISKFDYEHKIDFIYGFEVGKINRLFSTLMLELGTPVSTVDMIEFSDIIFKRSTEIRQAILKLIPPS